MSKNISYLTGKKHPTDNLFEQISRAAEDGTPSKEALKALADSFLVGEASTYGTATFYDFLKPENKGKTVYVCNGSACLCAGTQDQLARTIEKHVPAEKIGHMTCLGRCHENGAFHFNGHNYSNLSESEIEALLTKTAAPKKDQYRVGHLGTPVLTADWGEPEAIYGLLAKALELGPEAVLDEIITANVRGRGGAGFPMGFKLEACKKAKGKRKFIVCNADEGDPGAYTDRYLLEERPHLVLLGMIIAGFVTGAEWGIVYIRGEYPESVSVVESAVREIASRGFTGEHILGSDFNFHFKVIRAQGAYICGEETALLSSIEGQRPEVRIRPPYPVEQGLFNEPTVVNNVETLATIPYILKHGGAQYRALGTEKSSGTKLMSLDSSFHFPGVYEVEMGTPLSKVVYELGGGFRRKVKALHIGGPLCGLVPVSKIEDLTVDFESFRKEGFMLGHASVVGIPETFPIIEYLEHLFAFTAAESCGKCFPCRLGSVRGQELLHKARHSDFKIDRQLFDDLVDTLEKGSLCALGGGLPLPVKNALMHFSEELASYFA
ncbi:MAG: formate dehydrogenase [Bacteroidetes bacterium]|nr:MAG: formate dehydrogenase [Bacteroidota bacterium]